VWKLISQEILRFFCLPGLFSDLWMLWSRLGSCSTEMTRMHQFLNTVLLSWHNRFIGMLCERNWDGCSIFFFTILYILPGIRLQSGWSVFTSAFPLSLSLPVFVSLLVSYEIPQTVEHSLSTSFLSKEALLLIYQCFESCDMKTWLVINIVLISQTCFAMLTIFSRTTFSSKKENLIARLSKKSANRGMPQICFLGLW